MDIFMYGMFLLPLAVFVIVYAAEKVGAPNWYLILTGVMFGFVLTSVWRWVNNVPVEYISIPELWAVNVLVSLAALALFYIVKSSRPIKGEKGDTGAMGLPGRDAVGIDREVYMEMVQAVDRLQTQMDRMSGVTYTQEEQDHFDLMRYGRITRPNPYAPTDDTDGTTA